MTISCRRRAPTTLYHNKSLQFDFGCQMAAIELERALLLLTPGPLSVATGNCISLFTEALTAADGDFAGGSLPERYFPDNEIAASYAVHKQRARSSSAKSSSVESRSDESNSPARDLPESVPESDASESVDSGLADQRSRFQIWSANIGARDVGTSSLEYKLRDASDISHTVLDTWSTWRSFFKTTSPSSKATWYLGISCQEKKVR